MNCFPNILGNEDLRSYLASDIRTGSLAHAYIIEGALGSGKHTLALNIAAALACENAQNASFPIPCSQCPSCKKILNGQSPDVITVSRADGKAQLGVDIIRSVRESVRLLPNDLDVKVYIVEDAHTMNVQAQNAFLLTLEEPPKFVYFLLLCESSRNLLETIKSRAPIIRMRPLPEHLLRSGIEKKSEAAVILKKEAPEEFEDIVKLSSGFMGQALELLDEKKRKPLLASRHLAKDFLTAMSEQKRGRRSVELVSSFSKKREELIGQLTSLQSAVRDLIVVKKCDEADLCFFSDEKEAAELSSKLKISTLFPLLEVLENAKSNLSANSNVYLTMWTLAAECGLV
ncbi:MAG: hypothetical protein IKT56_04440 [Clostridia bacterium]|nr:hypothetical protein [Clostridia bacterium]